MGSPLIAIPQIGHVRPAERRDAAFIARLADMAGEGLPSYLWAGMTAPGQVPADVGTARAARNEGAFSWRNARVATWHGAPVGVAIAYDLDSPEPCDDVPPLLRPLGELECYAAETRYLNVLAVLPQARRRGVARSLLLDAFRTTILPVTLTVASGNCAARALYLCHGFEEVVRRRMGPGGPPGLTGEWILLRRSRDTGRSGGIGMLRAILECGEAL